MDIGLAIIRVGLGLLLFGHGTQKLFGWFDGPGLEGASGFMHSLGHRPGRASALLAGLGEAGGGTLLAIGLLTPLGSAAVIGVMAVAAGSAHWPKLWNSQGGMELPLTNAFVAAGLAYTGAGAYSVDAAIGVDPTGLGYSSGAVGLGLLAAVAVLLRRRTALRRTEPYPAAGQAPEREPAPR